LIGSLTERRIAAAPTPSSSEQITSDCAAFQNNPDATGPRHSTRIAIFPDGSTALQSTRMIFVLMVRTEMQRIG
jgi:hypothetical protein